MKHSLLKLISCFTLTLLMFSSCKKITVEVKKNLPKADFTFTLKNAGSLPTNVEFTSTSLNASKLVWSFDDSESSTEQAPKHSFLTAKTYNVKLVATNDGETSEITKEIIITDKSPTANFNFTIKNPGILPAVINFLPDVLNATKYEWTFDNGEVSTLSTPEITFKEARAYNVKLTITNEFGSATLTKQVTTEDKKPKADFSFTVKSPGILPTTVDFTSTSVGTTAYKWDFDDGNSAINPNPRNIFELSKTFNVKLIASNQFGSHEVIKQVIIPISKPIADFSYVISSKRTLPVSTTYSNTTVGSNISYLWSFDNGTTSTLKNPTNNFNAGGIFDVKLVATNSAGSDDFTKQIKISPYPQAYKDFGGITRNLYAWEGEKVMILSRSNTLNRTTMFKWLDAMDGTYDFYKACTGKEPIKYDPTYINNLTTIGDIVSTCGAGCGYIGFTGIEMQNTYFELKTCQIIRA